MNKRQDYFSNYLKHRTGVKAETMDDWKNGYHYTVDVFQNQLPAIKSMYKLWLECCERHEAKTAQLSAGCPAANGAPPTKAEEAAFFNRLVREIDAEYEMGAALAGAIFMVMSRGLDGYLKQVGLDGQKAEVIGQPIGQTTRLNFILCVANNVRHFEHWKAPGQPHEFNERGLRAAGIIEPLDQSIANQALSLMDFKDAGQINPTFLELTNAILEYRAQGPVWTKKENDEQAEVRAIRHSAFDLT